LPGPDKEGPGQAGRRLAANVRLVPEGPDGRRKTKSSSSCPALSVAKKGSFMSTQEEMDLLTYKINGAIFEVNRVLGSGFLEKVYENALLLEFKKQGLKAESQTLISVLYKGEVVGEYLADILVEDQVILELKAVDQLQKVYEAQLLNYLKATGTKVGLLVNFKDPKAEIKRFML
jgi:GxxExxY protein